MRVCKSPNRDLYIYYPKNGKSRHEISVFFKSYYIDESDDFFTVFLHTDKDEVACLLRDKEARMFVKDIKVLEEAEPSVASEDVKNE